MFRRQRMNHFTVATTAIAMAMPSVIIDEHPRTSSRDGIS